MKISVKPIYFLIFVFIFSVVLMCSSFYLSDNNALDLVSKCKIVNKTTEIRNYKCGVKTVYTLYVQKVKHVNPVTYEIEADAQSYQAYKIGDEIIKREESILPLIGVMSAIILIMTTIVVFTQHYD